MKFKKVSLIERDSKKNFLYGFIVCALLMILVDFVTSQAKYQTSQRIKLAEGKINYVPYDFKIMAMYQDDGSGNYNEIETMPSSGYAINEEKSYCTLDNKVHDRNAILYTMPTGEHVIKNLSKKDKCYLWFDKKVSAKDQILAGKQQNIRVDFSTPLTTDTTGTIYKAQDDDGESYYFAGATEDNWVKFAGFYWRIVRINGDGTIRLIYNGITTNKTGEGTQIGTSVFNANYNDNMYVGFMYEQNQVHGTIIPSTIKKDSLDPWYKSNITDKGFGDKVSSEAGFCNNRAVKSGTGIGITITNYGAYDSLYIKKEPDLKCIDTNDNFKTPVGLITADEVAYAGGVFNANNIGYYLYTNQYYWTLSPCVFDGAAAYMFFVGNDGYLISNSSVGSTYGVRPVINLRADTQFSSGNGTINSPYSVS